ncbi:hypothetical protein JCGZ_19565 [Jatropha curcas]|uniref:Uncharacterized protein n=1 Tax=Jatropha curcas TaxID=180498 RepID=A0A067JXZ8_JATCU|nr:hypothetical protein JCGZ_19565 [Jatropha curcas]
MAPVLSSEVNAVPSLTKQWNQLNRSNKKVKLRDGLSDGGDHADTEEVCHGTGTDQRRKKSFRDMIMHDSTQE